MCPIQMVGGTHLSTRSQWCHFCPQVWGWSAWSTATSRVRVQGGVDSPVYAALDSESLAQERGTNEGAGGRG